LYGGALGTLSMDEWRPSRPPLDFLAIIDADRAKEQPDNLAFDTLAYMNEHGVGK